MIGQIWRLSQTVDSASDLHLVDAADWPRRTRKYTLIGHITAEAKEMTDLMSSFQKCYIQYLFLTNDMPYHKEYYLIYLILLISTFSA